MIQSILIDTFASDLGNEDQAFQAELSNLKQLIELLTLPFTNYSTAKATADAKAAKGKGFGAAAALLSSLTKDTKSSNTTDGKKSKDSSNSESSNAIPPNALDRSAEASKYRLFDADKPFAPASGHQSMIQLEVFVKAFYLLSMACDRVDLMSGRMAVSTHSKASSNITNTSTSSSAADNLDDARRARQANELLQLVFQLLFQNYLFPFLAEQLHSAERAAKATELTAFSLHDSTLSIDTSNATNKTSIEQHCSILNKIPESLHKDLGIARMVLQIEALFSRTFESKVLPLVLPVDSEASAAQDMLALLRKSLTDQVNSLLQQDIIAWLKWIYLISMANQPKTDYRPVCKEKGNSTGNNSSGTASMDSASISTASMASNDGTVAFQKVCAFVHILRHHCTSTLGKQMAQPLLTQFSTELLRLVMHHLRTFTVSQNGAIVLLRDLDALQEALASYGLRTVNAQMSLLKELARLFLIAVDNIDEAIRSGPLRELDAKLILAFVAVREDCKKSHLEDVPCHRAWCLFLFERGWFEGPFLGDLAKEAKDKSGRG